MGKYPHTSTSDSLSPFSHTKCSCSLPHDQGRSAGFIARDAGVGVCGVGGHSTAWQDGVTTCLELAASRQGRTSVPSVKPSASVVWAPLPCFEWLPADTEAVSVSCKLRWVLYDEWSVRWDLPAVGLCCPEPRLSLWPSHSPQHGPDCSIRTVGTATLRWLPVDFCS